MDEEKDNLEEQKQAEAGQKTAHVAGKAAATYLGGAGGAKAYDLASQTAVGQELEKAASNRIQNNPALSKASQRLNESGALDAVEKGMDIANNDSNLKNVSMNNTVDSSNNKGLLPNSSSNESSDNTDDSEEGNSKILSKISIKKTMPIIASAGGIGCMLFVVFMLVMTIFMAGYGIIESIKNFFLGIINFFTEDRQELEEKYYKKLQTTQTKINEKYGVCIDVNLITASLIVETKIDDFLDNGETEIEVDDSSESESDSEDSGEEDYKQMTKQVELLAKMQIKTKKYGFDDSWKETNGSYCKSSKEEILVTSENESLFNKSSLSWSDKVTSLDSSTPDKISQNDEEGVLSFFKKKSNKEKNYAYYLYYPGLNSDGTCTESLPDDVYELSIGDYATMKESVFYWNLVNSFIPSYYEDYLPESEPKRTEIIKQIADEIYSLYDSFGPSQTCATKPIYSGPSSLCPGGITVIDKNGDGATINFEEYIAGVVSREAYSSEGMEALKAQAVAARTYAVNLTNYCEKPISNSTNAQTFTRDINDRAREATEATAGEILVNSSGNVFSAQYDSFCYDDKDCPDSKRNADGTYTVTYTKMPNKEQHVITLSDSDQYGRITHGQGHAHGMSQLVSYQMAKEGKTYQEILSFFYSDGVTISLVVSTTTTEGGVIISKPIEQYLLEAGTNIDNMNQAIFSQVRKAGVSTREGVVTAAVTLINNFYSQTGYLLPYELKPSGKYKAYGMDPIWGTNTGNSKYPLNGLDCSGYISWAVHNGGFNYETRSAKGWSDAGVKRPWSKGMTDTLAKPGDLIYNAPPKENGTTGHIRMIVEVTKDGYIVAEASGRQNGIRITSIPFISTDAYYLVDMDNYYANATKVTDYPQ